MNNQRMCVVCKVRKQKTELVRVSCLNGEAVVDQQKKQTGRAIYVCMDEHCIAILKKSNAIKRLLKVTANDEFYKNLI
ncbi:MAG: YlxR family protein [Christensenellales bacterium]